MFTQKTARSSAKVVDGNLIISLPDAKNPIVWRMALGEARAAALEVREQANEYVLVLKYPKGDSIDIAPFDNKPTATNALMAISKAMQEAHGQIKSIPTSAPYTASSSMGWKWIIPLALILAALFLFSRTASVTPVDYTTGTATANPTTSGNNDVGVPLSADSVLSGN